MTKNTALKPPADLNSPTGYCSHRNHAKCPYRPGGACENGIGLSDGGFYMCPCSCHMQQKHAVQGKRLQASLDTRKSAVAVEQQGSPYDPHAFEQWFKFTHPGDDLADYDRESRKQLREEWAAEQQEDSPKPRQSVVATILADHTPAAKTTSRKAAPASRKSTESTPKASGKGKASTAAAAKPQATNGGLSTAEKKSVRTRMAAILRDAADFSAEEQAYIEAHWLKYIDPDLDKARRDAAAAK